jgi:ATP-dependent RNA helicase DDX23/PRP28
MIHFPVSPLPHSPHHKSRFAIHNVCFTSCRELTSQKVHMADDDPPAIRFVPRHERHQRSYEPEDPSPAPPRRVIVAQSDLSDRDRGDIRSRYVGTRPKTYRNITPAHSESWNMREDTLGATVDPDSALELPAPADDVLLPRRRPQAAAVDPVRAARLWRAEHNISVLGKRRVEIPPIFEWNTSLPEVVVTALLRNGFDAPLPIQSQCIPLALSGHDVIGMSQPGTGKTLAYLIPMLVRIIRFLDTNAYDSRDGPLGVVLVPTRELAEQVATVLDRLCPDLGLVCFALVGGFSMADQSFFVQRGVHVLVATPGRLNDVLGSHMMVIDRCTSVVLDEADKMVDQSFGPQIERVLRQVPPNRSLLMFSATMPDAVLSIVEQFFVNVVRVRVGNVGDASETIKQVVHYLTKAEKKQSFLERIHGMGPPILVFVNSRESCEEVGNLLAYNGFKVASLHGGKAQKDRDTIVAAITDGIIDIVVATDVLSRGIDIEKVQHVVNYEVPGDISTYVHRIGRTGRAGESGVATSFVTPEDTQIMFDLTRLLQRNGFAVPDAMLRNPASQRRPEPADSGS